MGSPPHRLSHISLFHILSLVVLLLPFQAFAGNSQSQPAQPAPASDHELDLEAGLRFPSGRSTAVDTDAPDLPRPLHNLQRDYFQPPHHVRRTTHEHTTTQHLEIVTHQSGDGDTPRHDPPAHPGTATPSTPSRTPSPNQPASPPHTRSYAQAVKDGVKKCVGPACKAIGDKYNSLGKERTTYDSVVGPARITSAVAAGGASLVGSAIAYPVRINLGTAVLGAVASSYATHNLGQGNARPTARAQKDQYHAVSDQR